jgi:hypothetical protein
MIYFGNLKFCYKLASKSKKFENIALTRMVGPKNQEIILSRVEWLDTGFGFVIGFIDHL